MPRSLVEPLQRELERARLLHDQDLAQGFGEALLPHALARKYPLAAKDFGWQYISFGAAFSRPAWRCRAQASPG